MSFFPSFNGLQGIFNSSLLGWSQKPPSFSQTLNPHGSWACLPLAHSTFSPTKQAAYSPFLKEGWPTSLPWYPKMLIHLQSCGTNSISSVSHQAFKTCPSVPKELNFPHILYCTTCWFFHDDFSFSLLQIRPFFCDWKAKYLSTTVSSFLCIFVLN